MTQPFSAWAIDYIVNLPETEEGYCYLLLMVDTFTKWVELIPMRSKLSSEVATALKLHIIVCFGIPMEICCDRGQVGWQSPHIVRGWNPKENH